MHLLTVAERAKVMKHTSMRIDIGAKSKDSATKHANVGDRVTFLSEYEEIGDHAVGKAFDDRVGCAIIIELLKGKPYPFDLYASFTVQEEVGLPWRHGRLLRHQTRCSSDFRLHPIL